MNTINIKGTTMLILQDIISAVCLTCTFILGFILFISHNSQPLDINKVCEEQTQVSYEQCLLDLTK